MGNGRTESLWKLGYDAYSLPKGWKAVVRECQGTIRVEAMRSQKCSQWALLGVQKWRCGRDEFIFWTGQSHQRPRNHSSETYFKCHNYQSSLFFYSDEFVPYYEDLMGIVLMPASKHTSQILLLCINKFRYIIRATSDWYITSRCCLYCSCCYRLEMMTSELCLKTLGLPTSCAFTSEWTSPSWVDPLFCAFQFCKCFTPEVTWWHDVQAPLLSPIFCPPPPPQPEIWKLYKMDTIANLPDQGLMCIHCMTLKLWEHISLEHN